MIKTDRSMKKLVLFKGKKAKSGPVHTMDIEISDIWPVFFPTGFYEKYRYLGSVPWKEDGELFKAIEPLVIYMDYLARPWWCPRWFLRFLHLFGSDNSAVRVRNMRLHNLGRKLTKGLFMWDWKTKWADYDLRISVSGPDKVQNLAVAIEREFYRRGKRAEELENKKND
jgi:hypothetical protein